MATETTSAPEPYVFAGAGKGGLLRKAPGSDSWEELTNGLPDSAEVRALAVHPLQPDVIFAGTQEGLYRSGSKGEHWRPMSLPIMGSVIWSILFRPHNVNTMYVGTAPAQIFRTRDAGDTWEPLPVDLGSDVVAMSFETRVIAMAADPTHPDEIYAALEVGGVIRSQDGGDSWEPINQGLAEGGEDRLDLHGVQVSPVEPRTVFISTREGMFRGPDRGSRWDPIDISRYSPIPYTRYLLLGPTQPSTLYVSMGRSARGDVGSLLRSRDLGKTWERIDHGVSPNSTMMVVGVNARRPAQVFCATRHGQVFGSLDDGATWQEYPLPDHVDDVYALAVA
ncbi:MAG: hypothetical protein J4F43_04015 [Dehalococcoidia bacterium]|nr:hypothetical protein [Dehalococcoidia bacterium]